jgi:hypothetical protein
MAFQKWWSSCLSLFSARIISKHHMPNWLLFFKLVFCSFFPSSAGTTVPQIPIFLFHLLHAFCSSDYIFLSDLSLIWITKFAFQPLWWNFHLHYFILKLKFLLFLYFLTLCVWIGFVHAQFSWMHGIFYDGGFRASPDNSLHFLFFFFFLGSVSGDLFCYFF